MNHQRMLDELGDTSTEVSSTQLVPAFTNENQISQERRNTRRNCFSNALSSVQRLRETEDIRAIFQIQELGSEFN